MTSETLNVLTTETTATCNNNNNMKTLSGAIMALVGLLLSSSVATQAQTFRQKPVTRSCVKLGKDHVEPKYYREGACYAQEQIIDIIKDLVTVTTEAFEANDVTYFLDSGTLLGAFRDGKVIPHDVDADLGIDARGLTYLQQNLVVFPDEYELNIWNSYLDPNSTRDDKLPVRVVHKESGLYLDVFAFLDWTDEENGAQMVGPLPSWCMFNCDSCPVAPTGGKTLRVPKDWIYPLIACPFEGATKKCPAQTEKYLKYVFGADFRKPVKYTY
ncbi:hypothetical protein Poli38472_008835 [Pythium oligandrum]|uniref:LicD/FKTN/FKRP nucleotidyltransferase domain-containing protein n=1 Tax=Pythium oligandrum TaxID=41045 RepID=A0A8K1C4X6_PYTOL|nr:hypothetical protein Poli38472_008835 [Pythium oligandrum]|eukprot:TMW56187.1 hypothetical protein Poli38472_008835 [Pythium oligandrum]